MFRLLYNELLTFLLSMAADEAIALSSSAILRFVGYVFLRWIPGHPFPDIIFTAFAIYLAATFSILRKEQDVKTKQQPSDKEIKTPVAKSKLRSYTTTWALLVGLPSPRAKLVSVAAILTNTLIVLMVSDLTFSPKILYPLSDLSFARVGFVSDTAAKILVREPALEKQPVSLRYWISELPLSAEELPQTHLEVIVSDAGFNEATDYTSVFEPNGLQPDTRYSYLTSSNQSGSFTTAPVPGLTSTNANNSFTFVHSSCTLPNYPYVPFRHHLSTPGFKYLADLLPIIKAQFMVFLGDFIYIDVPRRFGTDKETYRREYRWVYASPDWPSVTNQQGSELPWIHVYDDHEIANDWDKNETGVYASAADPWQHYQVSVNPPSVRPEASYFSFVQGPASFFMMDTRRYRSPEDRTDGTWEGTQRTKTMLGEQQREDLLAWIGQKAPDGIKWKIIISSIPFTKNWRYGSPGDTWAGYLGERHVLLEAMWDATMAQDMGFVVLSGDRHEFAATAFPPPTTGPKAKRWPVEATVHEFSASPLSMFYLPIRAYSQQDDEDVCLKYLPDGNSKFGAVKIVNEPESGSSRIDYTLYIDGKEAWQHTLQHPTLARA